MGLQWVAPGNVNASLNGAAEHAYRRETTESDNGSEQRSRAPSLARTAAQGRLGST